MNKTNMADLKCPVCNSPIETGNICPNCGFEVRLFAAIPSEFIQKAERDRISSYKRVWDELVLLRQKVKTAKKPVGFLISDRLVVYCIYNGANVFGSASNCGETEVSSTQVMLFPGIELSPCHFEIQSELSDEGNKTVFHIKALSKEGAGVYVNSLTQKVDDVLELASGDTVILSSGNEDDVVELRFRKNIIK